MRKEKRKGGHVYNTASRHCCSLFLLVLHCPVFITVSVEQLFKYSGSLSCHPPPPGSLYPPVPLQFLLCSVTLREEGGRGLGFCLFFFSLAVGLDIFNFGRTKKINKLWFFLLLFCFCKVTFCDRPFAVPEGRSSSHP